MSGINRILFILCLLVGANVHAFQFEQTSPTHCDLNAVAPDTNAKVGFIFQFYNEGTVSESFIRTSTSIGYLDLVGFRAKAPYNQIGSLCGPNTRFVMFNINVQPCEPGTEWAIESGTCEPVANECSTDQFGPERNISIGCGVSPSMSIGGGGYFCSDGCKYSVTPQDIIEIPGTRSCGTINGQEFCSDEAEWSVWLTSNPTGESCTTSNWTIDVTGVEPCTPNTPQISSNTDAPVPEGEGPDQGEIAPNSAQPSQTTGDGQSFTDNSVLTNNNVTTINEAGEVVQVDGEDESRPGGAFSSASCDAPPVCRSEDPVACAQLLQTWQLACPTQEAPTLDEVYAQSGFDDEAVQIVRTLDAGNILSDAGMSSVYVNWGGSCPGPVTIMEGVTFEFGPVCDQAPALGPVFLAASTFQAALMLVRV